MKSCDCCQLIVWCVCVDALTVPLEIPQNFSIVNGSVNATSAAFTWLEVDTSFERIRGFFRGYQVLNSALIILFCARMGLLCYAVVKMVNVRPRLVGN